MKFPLQPVSELEEAEPFLPNASPPSDGARDFIAEDDDLVGPNSEDGLSAIGCRCCGFAGPAEKAHSGADSGRPVIPAMNIHFDSNDSQTRQRAETAKQRGRLSNFRMEDEPDAAPQPALGAPPPIRPHEDFRLTPAPNLAAIFRTTGRAMRRRLQFV